jgi:rare lipoprotein A
MRSAIVKTILPALLVAFGCTGPLASVTLAETGGAAATPAPTAVPPVSPGTQSKGALATYFGPGLFGQTTACGQTLSPVLVGIASRTLPCGTLVEVSYRGRHLTVPVLDRGPYSHIGAQWDLTSGAARALKIKETVRIRTAIVGSAPNTPTLGLPAETSPAVLSAPSVGAVAAE